MVWDNAESKTKLTKDGSMQYGFTGKYRSSSSSAINFKAKIWDFGFAWRGELFPDKCPSLENNWVSMPYNVPYGIRKQLSSDITYLSVRKNLTYDALGKFRSPVSEKMDRVRLWDLYCGVNGTNRVEQHGDANDSTNSSIQLALHKFTSKILEEMSQ